MIPPSSAPRRSCLRRRVLGIAVFATALPLAAAGAAAPGPSKAPLVPAPAPSSPDAAGLLALGDSLSAKGDYGTAEIAYRQVLNRPDFTVADQKTALLGMAHMYRRSGALTKAAAIYEKFLKLYPDDVREPDAFLDLGRTLRDMGAYDLAIARFYSVINTTLKLPAQGFDHYILLAKTAQFEIAQTYYEEGDYAEAGKFFTRVRLLDLAPADRARAHFMAGCAQQRAGELQDAVVTLRAFLQQWPDDANGPEARYVLATALDQLNRHQEALAITLDLLHGARTRVAADPRGWAYWQRRTGNQLANRFFQNGDILDALNIYLCLTQLSPDPAWRLPALYQAGLCYERLFQTDRAREAYRTIVAASKPDTGEAAPDISELAGMAAWRLQYLDWRDGITAQLTKFIAPGKVPALPSSPTAKPASSPTSAPAS